METIRVTERALAVLRRGLETAGLDPATTGLRVRLLAGQARVSFADEPEPGDRVAETGGLRLFADPSLGPLDAITIDVTAEHDQIVVR